MALNLKLDTRAKRTPSEDTIPGWRLGMVTMMVILLAEQTAAASHIAQDLIMPMVIAVIRTVDLARESSADLIAEAATVINREGQVRDKIALLSFFIKNSSEANDKWQLGKNIKQRFNFIINVAKYLNFIY